MALSAQTKRSIWISLAFGIVVMFGDGAAWSSMLDATAAAADLAQAQHDPSANGCMDGAVIYLGRTLPPPRSPTETADRAERFRDLDCVAAETSDDPAAVRGALDLARARAINAVAVCRE